MEREIVELYLDDIIPNRFQPREIFNETSLRELSQSIKEHGVIQPIIVRKIGDKYEIIAGERRYKASAMAGLTKIPAIIRNLDDKESSKVALLENLQRKDLTPIEEARTYRKILELDSMTQDELGNTMGKSQSAIANKMRLLSLPDEVQEALLKDEISERHARSLLNLKSREMQVVMLQKIIDNRMTVRELDNEVRKINEPEEFVYKNFSEAVEPIEIMEDELILPTPKIEIPQPLDLSKTESLFSEPEELIPSPVIQPKIETNIVREQPKRETFGRIEPIVPITTNNDENKPTSDVSDYSIKDVVNEIRDLSAKIQSKGFSIRLDEMDFEKSYQIIVKIDKK